MNHKMFATEFAVAEVFQQRFESLAAFPRMNGQRIADLKELSDEVRQALGISVEQWNQATQVEE